MDEAISTPRAMSPSGPSAMSGLVWRHGQPSLQMQDAVVETVVTHTTRTTTSFAPISLPRLPEPENLPMPSHLPAEIYPLATEPIPDDMKFFAMHLGDQRVVVQDDGDCAGMHSPLPTEMGGPGWRRSMVSQGVKTETTRLGVVGALTGFQGNSGGREARKRSLSFSRAGARSIAPTPPVTGEGKGKGRARSPPRKRTRGMEEGQEGALLSPLSSPEQDGPSVPGTERPSIGSGLEVAALLSLPNLVTHFESLPDKLQQHVMMQLLRRSRMPTIQRVTSFASIALKRDFVSTLPHELAVQILRCVDTKTLARATRVSQKWRRTIDTERQVWKQRLVDDNLWQGLGTEEEEEHVMKQRLATLRWKADNKPKGSTPSEEEILDLPSAGPPPLHSATFDHHNQSDDHPIPLKHVYRRRFTSELNWLNKQPLHRSFPGQGMNVVTCTQFDREKIITASDDHSINIYDINLGTLKRRLDGHEGGVWALEYRGDTLVTGSTDRTVRVWDLETYQEVHTFHGHSSTVRCLQIVEPVLDEQTGEYMPPYPLFVTGSRDSSLRVWKLPKKGEKRSNKFVDGVEEILKPEENPFHVFQLAGHTQAVRAIATYGRLCMSGSYDCTVRVWDIIRGTCIHVLTGHEARVYSLVYDRYRNRCASGSMDNTVKVWDVGTGECLHTLSGHTALVGLLEISPNYLVSAAADASLRIWDANTNTLKHILGAHGGAITCFAHDETKVVSGSEGSIKLWDIRTGQYIRELVHGIQSVWQVVFKDNILVAATSRAGATVFEIFDFGALDDMSGVDDEGLDGYRKPAWERSDPREPQTYQFDDDEGELLPMSGGGLNPFGSGAISGGSVRFHGRRNQSLDPNPSSSFYGSDGDMKSGGKGRRAIRRSTSREVDNAGPSVMRGSPMTRSLRKTLPGFAEGHWDQSTRNHNAPTSPPYRSGTPLGEQSRAGPSRTIRSSARRTSDMPRRSDSPTPVGDSSSGVDMMASTSTVQARRRRNTGIVSSFSCVDPDELYHLGGVQDDDDQDMDAEAGDVMEEEEEEIEEEEEEPEVGNENHIPRDQGAYGVGQYGAGDGNDPLDRIGNEEEGYDEWDVDVDVD